MEPVLRVRGLELESKGAAVVQAAEAKEIITATRRGAGTAGSMEAAVRGGD
jgi:hypothetical protein